MAETETSVEKKGLCGVCPIGVGYPFCIACALIIVAVVLFIVVYVL